MSLSPRGSARNATARVRITPLVAADSAAFLRAAGASRRLHTPWVSPPVTRAALLARLKQLKPPHNHVFAARRLDTDELVGYLDLTNIVFGLFRSGYVSYYAFAGHERQGLMKDALSLLIRHAFRDLRLHRLEANIQPGNLASIALVRCCGFSKEGYSPKYLKIRGRWRDHERWALIDA